MKTQTGFLLIVMGASLVGCSRVTVNEPNKPDHASPPPQQATPQAPPQEVSPTPPVAPSVSTPAVPTTQESALPPTKLSVEPTPTDTRDEDDSAYEMFYTSLASQGEWIQTPAYGYVFQPPIRDNQWAPYSQGHWVFTDQGWTWVSNEPWGWATYHYGRWVNLEGTGWVWVPGSRWAPAWVSWRHGGGYCGWAPLPPESAHAELRIGIDCDVTFHIGAGCYNFIPQQYMGERDYRPHYVDRKNNFTIIHQTTNITNITINKTVINNVTRNVTTNNTVNNYNTTNNITTLNKFKQVNVAGPSFEEINRVSRTPVQRVTLIPSNHMGSATLQGKQLAVFAPEFSRTHPPSTPPRITQQIVEINVNHGDEPGKPLQVSRSIKAAPAQETLLRHEIQAPAPEKPMPVPNPPTHSLNKTEEPEKPLPSLMQPEKKKDKAAHTETPLTKSPEKAKEELKKEADKKSALTKEQVKTPPEESKKDNDKSSN